jgi:hypothetical protein
MSLLLMMVDAEWFHTELRPTLTATWRDQSFAPCRNLCSLLLAAEDQTFSLSSLRREETLLHQIANGMHFDRRYWPTVVWECLFFGALEISDMQLPVDTYCSLLCSSHPSYQNADRQPFTPIEQALFGRRDVTFGNKYFRPLKAGFNDLLDVQELATYLAAQNPAEWRPERLREMASLSSDADREDELEFAREWFPVFANWYDRAASRGAVVFSDSP